MMTTITGLQPLTVVVRWLSPSLGRWSTHSCSRTLRRHRHGDSFSFFCLPSNGRKLHSISGNGWNAPHMAEQKRQRHHPQVAGIGLHNNNQKGRGNCHSFIGSSFGFATISTEHSDSREQHWDLDNLHQSLDPHDERMINELIRYKEQHGDVHVPAGTGRFAMEERKRLEVSEDLAAWVAKQRQAYRRFSSKKASKAKTPKAFHIKVLVLESMGFMWSEREAQWQRSFNRLEAHQQKHGTLHVDRGDDLQLWTWADQQRKAYHGGKLTKERYELLQELGFPFDLQDAKWWEFYNQLCHYQKVNGDTQVPTHYSKDKVFGAWIARQRRNYQSGELSQERIQALEKIGFSWDVHGDAWEKFYQELCDFHATHGHTRVSKLQNPALAHWADRQRRHLREQLGASTNTNTNNGDDELSPHDDGKRKNENETNRENIKIKISALDKLGFSWNVGSGSISGERGGDVEAEERAKRLLDLKLKVDVHEENWMENFRLLCQFQERFGHFSLPPDVDEYQELSNWVRHQRFLYKRGKMSQERVDLLECVRFPWTAQAARWDRLYEKLVRFHAEHGHTIVPTKEAELYRWLNQQKKGPSQHKGRRRSE